MARQIRILDRNIQPVIAEAVDVFRVVIINGPRQAGKSTLLRQLHARLGGRLFNLDDEALREAAVADPIGLISTTADYLFIDEVQRGGDALVRAIKLRVDDPANRTRFILAGSTRFLSVPTLAESLAGRAVIFEVWPFTQGEIEGRSDRFIDRLVEDALGDLEIKTVLREEYFARICAGGFPEPVRLPPRMRGHWFGSYVDTVTQRDVREFATARQVTELPRLLRFLAGKTAQELVKSRLARDVGIERHALASYLLLLDTVFLTRMLPAWSRNPLGKVTKAPKTYITDTGLAAHLQGVTATGLAKPLAPLRGPLVETFVHNEIVRQMAWSDEPLVLSHWRDRDGAEVDLIAESADGTVFGIEVKASSTVAADDFRWLRRLAERVGGEFGRGIVFYLGAERLSFGEGLTALPLSTLWV